MKKVEKEPKVEEPKIILELPGNVEFKVEYTEDGRASIVYGNNPFNRLCGMAIARDVFNNRLDITRDVDKKHPAWLNVNQRANIAASIKMIDETINAYAENLFYHEMEQREKGKAEEEKK